MVRFFKSHRSLILGLLALAALPILASFVPAVFADLAIPDAERDLIQSGIVTDRSFGATITTMVNYFTGFLGFLAVIVFIYAGVLWVLNMGNEDMITKARKIMTYAAGGFIVIILSYSAVSFITSSVDNAPDQSACKTQADCTRTGEQCLLNPRSNAYECAVPGTFDNPAAGTCLYEGCAYPEQCVYQKEAKTYACLDPDEVGRLTLGPGECLFTTAHCNYTNDEVCFQGQCTPRENIPQPQLPFECWTAIQCLENNGPGWYCSYGECKKSSQTVCSSTSDCESPQICSYGFCSNPGAEPAGRCKNSSDCAAGFVCDEDAGRCDYQGIGSGPDGAPGSTVSGSPAKAAAEESLVSMDSLVSELGASLEGIAEEINGLPTEAREEVKDILSGGSLNDKIARLKDMLQNTTDPAVARVLEKLARSLDYINDLRKELDTLKISMPESAKTLALWLEVSTALNDLIDSPDSSINLRRFQAKYRELRDMLRAFPVVRATITAIPAEGNVPFTVTFDGLDSIDPTGGTISDYKWTFLDNSGREVSLGNSPSLVHEFTEPNTYSIKLVASTSQRDGEGYKTAADGVSVVRVKANPPTSKVDFRINGAEVTDVYHITAREADGGVVFDPASTVPALGRTIKEYEWAFGDAATELRSTPTSVSHTYTKPGEYFVKLIVTDTHGVKDQKVVKLFIKSIAADIKITPDGGNVNTEFKFQGLTSRSDEGLIDRYEWVIQDERGVTIYENNEKTFFYKFESPGEYQAVLLVVDVTKARDNAVRKIKVISRTPTATFTNTIPEPNHPGRVEFDASNSYDLDEGDLLTYSWDFNGDGIFEIVDSREPQAFYDYKKPGEYRVRLQVQDAFAQRDLTEKTVSVSSVLSGDIVLEKYATQVGEEVKFSAKSSNAVAYLWEFGDNETASSETPEVTHTYARKGRYQVRLHFFDENDGEGVDTATLLVGNSGNPVAEISTLVNGRDSSVIEDLCGKDKPGIRVTRADNIVFSGQHSINTDGSSRLLLYDWQFSDGLRSNKKELNHRFDQINAKDECGSVSLSVRDDIKGDVSPESIVYVKVVNELPTITDFILESEPGRELVTPTTVKLRAVNPKDTDGSVKRYRWWYYREGDQERKLGLHSTTVPETQLVVTAVGEPNVVNRYFFVLEVTDSDGGIYLTDEKFGEVSSLEIKNGPNLSPVTDFTMDKTTVSAGDSISFVSNAYDPQGDPLPADAFYWDFDGDGQFDDTGTGAQVSRQFNTPGTYNIRLKVTYRGLSSSVTKTVFVEQTENLPQAAFTYTIDGASVTFDGANSRFDPELPDTTLRFEWDFDVLSDSNGNAINDDDIESTDPRPVFRYPQLAVYKVRLKVKDMLGMEGVVVREVNLNVSEQERQRDSYRSLSVTSPDQGLASLDITASPARLGRSGTADVRVTVMNPDNSPYFGQVFFEVVEGSGEFTPNPVDAKNSKASAIFRATDPGPVRIRVKATGTYYGDIIEDATITVTP